ncbi:beta propeller repeat protein [Halorubrum vacuolatum]|uniref:BNR/Asp-box repeat-containing protein n=1 Tax=Halorubrum vacuolatum TaxID=63740 RepID=A0A238W8H0_HALVU|nr:hypothetical protein [Halorubrum vacuolatum]SNR42842.1 hypothetical protein SAMN06264855_10636 [Halorubrum vacuolatum]
MSTSAPSSTPSRAYAAYRGGLAVIDDPTGEATSSSIILDDRDVECVAATGSTLFAGTFDEGLIRSTDAGETVERLGTDAIDSSAVTAVAISPHDPDVIWVGTEPSRVYRSTDGGDSFERRPGLRAVPSAAEWSFPPRPETDHVRWIEPAPADPDRWYVGIEAGALLVTPDDGETWIDRPEGARRDNHTLATHPMVPKRVYAAAGDGYAESTDRGRTWTTRHDGLDHGYVWGLAVDPTDPETVLVSAAANASDAHRRGRSYLYRRSAPRSGHSTATDDGRTVTEERATGTTDEERTAAGTDGTTMAIDGERTVTTTWERLDGRGVPCGDGIRRAVLASGVASGEFWMLHEGGLFRTTDTGDSFDRIDVDLPDSVPRALALA